MTTTDFLIEILSEEIPHQQVLPAIKKFKKILEEEFFNQKISFKIIEKFSTPRRLALLTRGIPTELPPKKIVKKGPLVKVCFKNNLPTPILKGFIKESIGSLIGKEIPIFPQKIEDLKELTSEENKSGFYLLKERSNIFVAFLDSVGVQNTKKIISSFLPVIFKKLVFDKMMYWGNQLGPFIRPIHSILALWGKEIVSINYFGITSSNETKGHFPLSPEKIIITQATDYEKKLLKHKVIASHEKRIDSIKKQIAEIEKNDLSLVAKEKVIPVVNNLSEYPQLFLADFEKEYLEIPEEVITTEMIEHQKYFPVKKKNQLTNQFVITANILKKTTVVKGNQKVLKARLNDGRFLYQTDLKVGLKKMSEKLKSVIFQEKLGTYQKKIERILIQSQELNKRLKLGFPEELLQETATLLKSDLASEMVGEFPHLQGMMGYYYAKTEKKNYDTVQAIKEHYQPISNEDILPENMLSNLFSLSDKLDNILGLFSIGLIPTASQDRYGLKRQTYAVIRILIEKKLSLDLNNWVKINQNNYKDFFSAANLPTHWQQQLKIFFQGRMRTYLIDKGYQKEDLSAVLIGNEFNPLQQYEKIAALQEFKKEKNYENLLKLFKRIENIIDLEKKINEININLVKEHLLKEEAEWEFFNKKKYLDKEILSLKEKPKNFLKILKLFGEYQDPLNNFFDQIMISHPDKELRENRQHLLKSVYFQIKKFINISALYHKEK